MGAILVQNTTWTNVQKTLDNLRPVTNFDADKILDLTTEELQELIRPSGFFKNKSKPFNLVYNGSKTITGIMMPLQLNTVKT